MKSELFFLFCTLLYPFNFFTYGSFPGIRTKLLLTQSSNAKTSLNLDIGLPWRSPLAVIKYFKPFYEKRKYCEIGLRDSTLLFIVAKHASKAIGIERAPWGCRLAQNKLKAMEKQAEFLHNVQILCRDAFVGDLPEADFYYLWIGDCKLYSLVLPNSAVGVNISFEENTYFRRDLPCNTSVVFGYCADYMKDSSFWLKGYQPMPNHSVMPILSEKGKRFFLEKYGRHFEAIGIPYDERTKKEKYNNNNAIKYRTSWDSNVIGYPKHGYWTVFFSEARGSCDHKES